MTVDLLSLKTGVSTTEGVEHLLAHHALSHVGHLYPSHCTVERSWERWKPTVLDENAINSLLCPVKLSLWSSLCIRDRPP